ncbi:MAG: hypothetical protein CVT49_00425 [candidate division Zixibacteria bacterium HGW-Zixibacteria-1]|nr:MAG: hypothetical protein CVT49_00425 [candidate division Zixibacteria bacterium HGW-Zixibacteria-1]
MGRPAGDLASPLSRFFVVSHSNSCRPFGRYYTVNCLFLIYAKNTEFIRYTAWKSNNGRDDLGMGSGYFRKFFICES